jgi:hypothetical protein
LPRRSRRGWSISDAHRPHSPGEHLAIDTILVVDEVLWGPPPAAWTFQSSTGKAPVVIGPPGTALLLVARRMTRPSLCHGL